MIRDTYTNSLTSILSITYYIFKYYVDPPTKVMKINHDENINTKSVEEGTTEDTVDVVSEEVKGETKSENESKTSLGPTDSTAQKEEEKVDGGETNVEETKDTTSDSTPTTTEESKTATVQEGQLLPSGVPTGVPGIGIGVPSGVPSGVLEPQSSEPAVADVSVPVPAESSLETVIIEKAEVSIQYVGRVIGKGGEQIRDLQARSGCKIDVDQNVPAGAPRVVTYQGTRKTIDFAKQLVAILCSEGGKDADLPLGEAKKKKLQVPATSIGKIIGRGGDMIKVRLLF